MRGRRWIGSWVLALAMAGAGCSGTTSGTDVDAGGSRTDTGARDGAAPSDTGTTADTGPTTDSGTTTDVDSGATTDVDSGTTTDVDSGITTDVDAGTTTTTCGGRLGGTCDRLEYCDYPDGDPCGRADSSGECRLRPTTCTPSDAPVCGCDGLTYANACEAERAATDVSATGSCAGAATFACGDAIRCATGDELCRVVVGGAAGSAPRYSCEALPPRCAGAGTVPSCSTCFGGGGGPPGGMCMDGGAGEITVTLLTP